MFGTLLEIRLRLTQKCNQTIQDLKGPLYLDLSGNLTMVSYAPSKGKAGVLLSTMPHTATTEGEEDKLEIVLNYNKTKSGVDNMDHLAMIFSCRRKTIDGQWLSFIIC